MQLVPKTGIDNIVFGVNTAEVVTILGEPDKIFSDTYEPDEIIYQYNQHKLSLTFYSNEDNRLGYIRCSNPELTVNNKKVIKQSIATVQQEVFSDVKWDIEQYNFFETYFNEDIKLTLNVEYEEITDIEIGVPVNAEYEYEWVK